MFVNYKSSWDKRALALLLAVAVVFVGLPFVGVDTSLKASAETLTPGDGNITSTSTTSKYMGFDGNTNSKDTDTGESNYKYTGRIKPVSVDMYDYLTDAEIANNNANWNNLNDNKYTWYKFYNPYNTFNNAISSYNAFSPNEYIVSPSEENITIEFVSDISLSDVYLYLMDSTNDSNVYASEPGVRMEADSTSRIFTYTVRKADLPFESAKFYFNGGIESWRTSDITPNSWEENSVYSYKNYCENSNNNKTTVTLTYFPSDYDNYELSLYSWGGTATATDWPGNKMTVSGSSANIDYTGSVPAYIIFNYRRWKQSASNWTNVWQTKDINRYMVLGHNYSFKIHVPNSGNYDAYFNVYPFESTTAVQNITTPHYTTPLYFGLFLQPDESYKSSTKPNTTGSYSTTNHYSNFWWQANMAQRNSTASSIQNVVDKNLTVNPTTKEKQLTQGGVELPYFSSAWADSNKSNGNAIMKYWKSTESDKISFPFYEVLLDASKATGYKKGENDTSVTPEKAQYYQFNSKDSTVYFNSANKQFVERDPTTQKIRDTNGNSGFFPYNDNNDSYGKYDSNNDYYNEDDGHQSGINNNYGFGAKFQMTFKLNSDGKVSTVKENGESLEGAGKVNTRFEFTGDDDLWVFIDDHLVLDMGGAHAKSSGYIDFADKEAVATEAISLGDGSGKDDLKINSANVGSKKVDGTNFTSLINGYTSSKGYDPTVVHTMTIFYMERGMSESNLKIRYNFDVEANFSKMKVKEQTNFSNVNAGLKDLTQKAAEYDVFQYTVYNQGTNKDNVLKTNTKYPTLSNNVRTVQGVNTKLTSSNNTTTSASHYFQPPNTTGNHAVGNVTYNWVDEYAGMTSKVGAGGITDGQGRLYLLHGTPKDGNTSEVKSSAEFEGQFDRYSVMQISQSNQLYKPNEHKSGNADNAATLSNVSNGRLASSYYTTKQSIFSTICSTPVEIGANEQFTFRNDIDASHLILNGNTPDENTESTVQMTELFVNTVKTGTLNITKKKTGLTTNSQDIEYSFQLTLTDVFGNSNVQLSSTDYQNIVISKSGVAGTSKLGADGTFTLKVNQTATITGVPYGTKFTIQEKTDNLGAETNYNNTTIKNADGSTVTDIVSESTAINSDDIEVSVTNNFDKSIDVTVKKEASDGGTDVSGAELELYYKETTVPETYSSNNPEIVPNKVNGMTVSKSAADVGIPGLQVSTSSYKYYTNTTSYSNPTVPSSSDKDWILPRNDTDYIYFRDYNIGIYTGEHDSQSFTNTTGNRSWLYTTLKENDYNQIQEINYTHNYWFAAQFSGSGKNTVTYAMWERFVDEYTTGVNTVVWKIQPPDGYTNVRFMLYDGNTCIRTTQLVKYELGKIYNKTSWGGWWASNDGKDCYFDVPCTAEGYWANTSDTTKDQRNTNSAMSQARKYTPTNDKIIFHCNSEQVWHNIHIEFFKSNSESDRVEGQAFPGYMMEPYAYAGSNYRLSDGFLTYELTIPEGATHFRINNGVSSDPYSYRTEITEIKTDSTQKNGGNYFILGSASYYDSGSKKAIKYNCTSGVAAPLYQCIQAYTDQCSDNVNQTYTTSDITSDYDYIYFEKPDGWDKVYAYYYGGGNLRDDNWQRACYSSWPGIAPVGTDYVDGTDVHSNSYSINTIGDNYNGTSTDGTLSPEATFTLNGKTIYKFRLPKGDAKNYSKVIFNDGLNGGKETGVIDYQAGYIYSKSGAQTKHYENKPTQTYTGRTNNNYTSTDKKEYIYIKNTQIWDDPHITFYDSNGNQILQGGCGYVMDYAGKQDSVEYYRMPIPTNAAKFSVNNGMGKASTDKYDIIRLGTDGKPTGTQSADDKFVYELNETALTRLGYSESTSEHTVTTSTAQTEVTTGYTVRQKNSGVDDTLNICDNANWDVPIGGISVTFYTSTGTVVGSGSYVMMKTNADSDGKVWYTKKIPTTAAAFSVSYTKDSVTKTTSNYPIYPTTADSNGNVTTSGNMYYKTEGTNKLSIINAESTYTEADDEVYQKRGDYLYLKCLKSEKDTYWKDMKVTFYANGDNIICSNVTAKFVNDDDDNTHSWYRVSIPTGAESFKVTGGASDPTHTTEKAEIFELKTKYSRYQDHYTLGDMQYELPSSGSSAKLLYPIFTKDDEYTLEVSNGNTISSVGSIIPVDAYSDSGAAATAQTVPADVPSPQQVLYETEKNNISYTWTGSSEGAANTYIRLTKPSWMTSPKVSFYVGSSWTVYNNMTSESGDTYICNTAIPTGATKIKFQGTKSGTSVETGEKTLPSDSSTKNYLYTITENTCTYIDYLTVYTSNMDHIIIHLWGDGDSGTFGSVQMNQGAPSGLSIPSGNAAYKYQVPSGKNYTDAIIFNDNSNDYWCMHISGMQNGGRGQVYYRGTSLGDCSDKHNSQTSTKYKAELDTARSYSANGNASYSIDDPSVYNTTAAATYQPEDRYGMISTLNSDYTPVTDGTADENNFIYISTQIFDPYIMFYSDTAGENKIGGSSMAKTGISLKEATLDGTDVATETGTENLYKIRLPKDAQSFVISNGDTTLGSNLIPLTETIYVKSENGTLCDRTEEAPHIQLDNYRHAGTTFTIGSDGAVTGKKLRANMTYNKQSITDPLNPRTDADYIFFTDDSSNTFGGSGTTKTVYAYYYGGADGEYTAWPGIQASTADAAPLVYTDNNDRKVYMFRLPSIDNGKYPYVIFNNGSDSSRKVTQAISIMNDEQTAYTAGGNNYILNSGTKQNYGTYDSTANSTNYVQAYPTRSESKIIESNLDYNSSGTNKYIYIINNGTANLNGGERNVFDDMHVMFYDSNKYPIGSYTPGYKPDKILNPTSTVTGMASGDVYRIQVPSNAVYFQINNGTKGTGTKDYERQSEIKQITPSALYQFVDSAGNVVDYIEETSTPSKQSEAHFLLDIVNRVTESDEEIPETETIDIHIATVVTKANGEVDYIKWVKDYTPGDSPSGSIDTNYIANTATEIGETAHAAKVKVKKEGEYYWKESVAPSGYKISNTEATFQTEGHTSSDTSTITDDPNPTGSLTLNKKLYSVDSGKSNSGENQNFKFTVTLIAPVGTDWSKEQHNLTYTKGGNSFSPTTDARSATSLTRVITMSIPADGTDVKIDNIPSGTYYYVTETAPDTNYTSTPVIISQTTKNESGADTTKTVSEISGEIPSYSTDANNAVKYVITNKREVGSLTLAKTVTGSNDALDKATVTNGTTPFIYTVTLKAPDNVDLRNYLAWSSFNSINATITKVNGSDFTSSEPNYNNISSTLSSIEFTVEVVCNNGSKTIVNLPIGTKYTVTENEANASGDDWECTTSGQVTYETAITDTNLNPVVTITNSYKTSTEQSNENETILTKIAKDSVGTTPIGAPLAGAGFKLVKVEEGTEDDEYRFTLNDSVTDTNEYTYAASGGTYNQTDSWLTTGADGKLHIKNLPDGDYYLVEQTAPSGYSVNTTHFEFNVNEKTVTANDKILTSSDTLTCYDEMAPAYIKLYEHINERRTANWGDPTFIFKITQTKDAAGEEIPEENRKTRTVALTVDDDGELNSNVLIDSVTDENFNGWKVEYTDEDETVNEKTVKEYQGMYHIDDQGRIKVELGTYEITRVPVSRYKFVTAAKTAAYSSTGRAGTQTENLDASGKPLETVTITDLKEGQTVDVHYYDKVEYYDKFTHVDTKINQFYKTNVTIQANKAAKAIKATKANVTIKATKTNVTIKGIRVEYTAKVPTSSSPATIETTSNDFKAWYIFADGTEGVMNSTEKAKINFITSDADATIKSNLYPNGNKLTISNPSDYASKVYTIKASYTYTDANTTRQTTFTTNFDIAFASATN